ncbi:MAG: hypothetical protein JW772_01895 [Candidatus Diapherotrites archaeon]|nr:hypothetical protein [Candidatus Diapherotrites archaeon]
MGKTVVIMKITPKEEQIDRAMADLKTVKSGALQDVQKVPVAFGIEILKAAFTIEEKAENALSELEEEVAKLDSIENSEVENMTLL